MASLYDRMRSAGLRREENSDGSYKVSNDTSRSTNTFGDAKNRENLLRQIAAERVQQQAAEQARQANSLRIAQDYAKTQQDTMMNIAMGSVASGHNLGRYGQGNIDLYNRPQYKYPNGSTATVESMSFGTDEGEILVPTIDFDKQGNPIKLTDDQSIDRYYNTGEYLGKFKTIDEANAYADKLHRQQERYYGLSRNNSDVNTSMQEQLANLPQAQSVTERNKNSQDRWHEAVRNAGYTPEWEEAIPIESPYEFAKEYPLMGAVGNVASNFVGLVTEPLANWKYSDSREYHPEWEEPGRIPDTKVDVNDPLLKPSRAAAEFGEGIKPGIRDRVGVEANSPVGKAIDAATDIGLGLSNLAVSSAINPIGGATKAAQAIRSGVTFAISGAMRNNQAIATGNMSVGQARRGTAVSGISGAAAGLASGLVSSGLANVLKSKGMMTPFMEFVRRGTSASAFAGTNTMTNYALSENKPSNEDLAKQLVTDFAFAWISSGISTLRTTAETKARLARMSQDVADQYARLMSYGDVNVSAAGITEEQYHDQIKKILQYTAEVRQAVNSGYIPGGQEIVNQYNSQLDLIEQNMMERLNNIYGSSSTASPTTSNDLMVVGNAAQETQSVASDLENAMNAGLNDEAAASAAVNNDMLRLAYEAQGVDAPANTDEQPEYHYFNGGFYYTTPDTRKNEATDAEKAAAEDTTNEALMNLAQEAVTNDQAEQTGEISTQDVYNLYNNEETTERAVRPLNEGFMDDADYIAENEQAEQPAVSANTDIAEQRQASIEELSANLGETGQEAYVNMYGEGGPESVIEYNEGFTKLYNAARNADPQAVSEARMDPAVQKLSYEQQSVAVSAGTEDARIDLRENIYGGQARENGYSTGPERLLGNSTGEQSGGDISSQRTLGESWKAEAATFRDPEAKNLRPQEAQRAEQVIRTAAPGQIVYTIDGDTAETSRAKATAKAYGVKNYILYASKTGGINVQNSGRLSLSRGFFDGPTDTIGACANNSEATAKQITDHETVHRAIALGHVDVAQTHEDLKVNNEGLASDITDITDAYIEWSNGGLTKEQAMEELFCDAGGGINQFEKYALEGDTEAQDLADIMADVIAELRPILNEKMGGVLDADSTEISAVQDADKKGVEIVDGAAIKYSMETWNATDKKELKDDLVSAGYEEETAAKWIDDVSSVAAIIARNPKLDYKSGKGTWLKNNAETVKSLDGSFLCPKKSLFQGTYNAIVEKLPNLTLDAEQYIALKNLMKEMGHEVPCVYCYNESRQQMIGTYAKEFIEQYKGSYKLTSKDLTTNTGLSELETKHPDIFKDWLKFRQSAHGAQRSVKFEANNIAYTRNDIMSLSAEDRRAIMAEGGLRWFAFSDFKTEQMIDAMQAVLDLSAMNMRSYGYTKQENFVKVFGNTGIMINMSVAGKVENGKLVFNDADGMNIETARALRKTHSKTAGITLLGVNDEHILMAMASPEIDMIIPFHRSGLTNQDMKNLGISDYTDYQQKGQQIEHWVSDGKACGKNLLWSDYWNYTKSGKENAERYLRECRRTQRIPKFSQFLDRHEDSNGKVYYTLKADGSTDGYYKVLVDFKMYDNDGTPIIQQEVQPIFDMDAAREILENYDGDANELPVAWDVVNKVVNDNKNLKLSTTLVKNNTASTGYDTINQVKESISNLYPEASKEEIQNAAEGISEVMQSVEGLSSRSGMRESGTTVNDIRSASSLRMGIQGKPVSNGSGNTASVSNGIRTIANGITDEFVNRGFVDFSGKILSKDNRKAIHDIASMAMIFRNPKFETFRMFYTKGNEIVGSEAVSSKLMSGSRHTKETDLKNAISEKRIRMKRLGADGYFMLHNHPSGDPNASVDDVRVSNLYINGTKGVPGLKGYRGHIVIDHNQYSYIDANGNRSGVIDIQNGTAQNYYKRVVDHPYLYKTVGGPDDFANMAIDLVHNKDYSVIVYAKGYKIRGMQEVHNNFVKSKDFEGYISNRKLDFGSDWAVLLTGSDDLFWSDRIDKMIEHNLLTDCVTTNRDSLRQMGATPDDANYNERGQKNTKAYRVNENTSEYTAKRITDDSIDAMMENGYTRKEAAEAVEAGGVVKYSTRLAPPPKKTITAYKAFYAMDGKLYPPMVANDVETEQNKGKKKVSGTLKGLETPVGVWIDADVGRLAYGEDGKPLRNTKGRLAVKNDKGGGTLAFRPGWHLGLWPDAKQFNVKDPITGELKACMPDGLVFARCSVAADYDYQLEALGYGMKTNGKFDRTQAGLPRIPKDGYYMYRTNVDPTTAPWIITGAIKVEEILDDDMSAEICAKYGITADPRASHKKINLADYGLQAGSVTPTEDMDRFLPNEAVKANAAALEEALADAEYADAYVARSVNFDDPEIIKELAMNKQNAAFYKEAQKKYGNKSYAVNNPNDPLIDKDTFAVPAIVANDAMKESVLYAGQPMYSTQLMPNREALERSGRELRQLGASRNVEAVRRTNDILAVLDREFNDALTDVKGSHVTQHQVSQIADKYTSGLNADEKKDVKQSIKELYELIGNATKTNARELIDAAASIADKVLSGGEHYERNPQMKELSKELKRTKFWISPELKKEIEYHFGSYTEFRRQYSKFMGMTLDRNRATSFVDQWYQGADRGWFNEEIINEAEQLLQIAEVAKYVAIGDKISDEYMGEDYEEVMYTMAQEILADYFKANGNEKYMQKINKVKQELKEDYQARLDYLENKYNDQLSKTNVKLAENQAKFLQYKEDQRNKRYDKQMRDKLWSKIRELKKMKGNAQFNQEKAEIFNEISAVRRGALSKSTEAKLKAMAAEVQNANPLSPAFSVKHHLAALNAIEELDKKHVGNMTAEEVETYLRAVTELIHYQRMENRLLDESRGKYVSAKGRKLINQQDNVSGIDNNRFLRKWLGIYRLNSLAPIRALPLFDGYVPDGVMAEYSDKFFDGDMKNQKYAMEANKAFEEWLEDEQYMRDLTKYDVKLKNMAGREVTISRDMAIALYLAGQDEGNVIHSEAGGWLIPEEKPYIRGDRKNAYFNPTEFVMRHGDYAQLENILTDRDKAFAKRIQQYFNEDSKKAMNEVSNKLYGYDIAMNKNYFPIIVDKDLIASDIDVYNDPTIENSGFTKERTKSSLPIYLDGVTNVLKRSINNVGRYYGMAVPLRDFNNVFNFTAYNNPLTRDRLVSGKKAFGHAWKSAGMDYIQNLISDLNRGSREKPRDILDYVYMGYGSAVLGANVRVMLSQASSYPMALTVLHPDSLAKGLATGNKKVDMDYIDSITPSMYMRRKGMTGTELGEMYSTRERLKDTKFGMALSKAGNAVEAIPILGRMVNGIQKVDVWTTTHLVSACIAEMEKYHSDLKPGTAAYNKQLASLIEQVNSRTQPSYGTMNRNEISKRPGLGYKMVTMFKTQTFNMFGEAVDAIGRDAAMRKLYKDGKVSKAVADKARGDAAKAIIALLLSQVLFETIKKAVNMSLYHDPGDDRDEYGDVTAANVVESTMKSTMADIIGMAPGADMVVNQRLIPLVKNAMGGKETIYDLDAPGVGMLNDIASAGNNLAKAIAAVRENPSDENKEKLRKRCMQFVIETSYMGYPLQNIYNNLNGVYMNAKYGPFNYERGEGLLGLKDKSPTAEQNAKKGVKLFEQGDAAKGTEFLERSNQNQIKAAMGASNQDGVVEYLKESGLSEESQRILWELAGYKASTFDKAMNK